MSNSGEYPTVPLVSVGGVVIFDGRAALIRRGNEPRRGEWSIPGGKLELGESLVEGVRREVREEIGLEVEVVRLIEALDRVFRDEKGRVRFHYVILDYLCRASSADVCVGGDALDVALVSESEFERYELSESVVRVLRKAFEMSRRGE
ncbi:MAG: NUDIX hydrolase [Acidobacteriota bacterium]|nr:NUDIX hydrolase [Acidobacteriota bacterium]